MKKFSYLEDFDSVLATGTMQSDSPNVATKYLLQVGESEPQTFLANGDFYSAEFTTQQDADNALKILRHTLALVDENLAQDLKLADVRDEILAKINHATSGNLITKRKATRAVRDICDYYISNGE